MARTLGNKLIEMKYHHGLHSNLEETDISGAHLLDQNHDHTIAQKPEYVDNSSDCDEVNKTEVDNGFGTLSREECKKEIKKRRVLRLPALKHRKRCSAKKEARGSAPSAQNSASLRGDPAKNGVCRIIQQKRDKEEEIGKSMSPHIVSCAQSPSSSSTNSAGRVRMLCRVYSSSGSSCSSICCSPSDLDPIDERQRHKLLGRKSRKKQNELKEDLRISKNRYSDNQEGVQQKTDKNVENSKSISAETASGTEPPIPSTSRGNSEKITRMCRREDRTSTFASFNTCSSSELESCRKKNSCGKKSSGRKRMLCHEDTPFRADDGVEAAQLIKLEKRNLRGRKGRKPHQLESHKLDGRKYRKEENERMEELRVLIPSVSNIPNASKASILIFARKYIRRLQENLETHKKMVEDLRNKQKSLEQEFKNLKNAIVNISIS